LKRGQARSTCCTVWVALPQWQPMLDMVGTPC
jgi:hypothetical protein